MAYVTMLLSKKPKSTSWLMGCFPPFSMCEANPWRNQKAPPDLAHNLGPPPGDGAVLAPVLPLTFLHFCPPPCSSAPTLIWPPPLDHYGSGSLNITGLQRNYHHHLLNAHYLPGTVLSVLHILIQPILSPWDRHYQCHSLLIVKDKDATEFKWLAQGVTPWKLWGWDSNSGSQPNT